MSVNRSEAKADSTKLSIATDFLPFCFQLLAHCNLSRETNKYTFKAIETMNSNKGCFT